jgi:hypothetical protein
MHFSVYNRLKDVNVNIRRDYEVLTTRRRADPLHRYGRRSRTMKTVSVHRLIVCRKVSSSLFLLGI